MESPPPPPPPPPDDVGTPPATPSFSIGVGDARVTPTSGKKPPHRRKSRQGSRTLGYGGSSSSPTSPTSPLQLSPGARARVLRPGASPIGIWKEDQEFGRPSGAGAAAGAASGASSQLAGAGGAASDASSQLRPRPPPAPDLTLCGSTEGERPVNAPVETQSAATDPSDDVADGAKDSRESSPRHRHDDEEDDDSVAALLASAGRLASAFRIVTSDLDRRLGVSEAARELDSRANLRLGSRLGGPRARATAARSIREAVRAARKRAEPVAEEWRLEEALTEARRVVREADRRHGVAIAVAGWMDGVTAGILGEEEEEAEDERYQYQSRQRERASQWRGAEAHAAPFEALETFDDSENIARV